MCGRVAPGGRDGENREVFAVFEMVAPVLIKPAGSTGDLSHEDPANHTETVA